MISKCIPKKRKHDNYARLAAYISGAGECEKNLMAWCCGCINNEDYNGSIEEVVDTQHSNSRTNKIKTYHLLISFRHEDEHKLTPEIFKAIEERFAETLGYTDHQRHCGVHKNTDNIHMHIAYNMIHPERLTRYEEWQDYIKRDALCRQLEKEYGLAVDLGRDKNRQKQRLQEKAATVEAQTGQESFESYAKGQRLEILSALEHAQGWQDLHEALARRGMEITPHGNGLAIKDRHGKHAVKASAVDRALSLKKLEKFLGRYTPPRNMENTKEETRYAAQPLHRSPQRGDLYAQYQAGIEKRKTTLEAIKERENAIKEQWAAKRRELAEKNLPKKNLHRLLALARKHEAEALAKARLQAQPQKEALRREVPYTSWKAFLQHEADHGSEIALAVLRSRKETAEPERALAPPAPAKDWSQHGQEYTVKAATRAEYAEKERALLEQKGLTVKGQKRLLAVLHMEELTAEEKALAKPGQKTVFAGMTNHVDGKGVVIFTLASGGRVRDTGREIVFSAHDEAAKEAAELYAAKKWGRVHHLEPGRIISLHAQERKRENETSRTKGMER